MISVSNELRAWFLSRSTWNRKRAAERAAAVLLIDGYLLSGLSVRTAIAIVAVKFKVNRSTLAVWRSRSLGVPAAERIYHLCDRRGS